MGGLSCAKLVILKNNTKLMRMILHCMLNTLCFLTEKLIQIKTSEKLTTRFFASLRMTYPHPFLSHWERGWGEVIGFRRKIINNETISHFVFLNNPI